MTAKKERRFVKGHVSKMGFKPKKNYVRKSVRLLRKFRHGLNTRRKTRGGKGRKK